MEQFVICVYLNGRLKKKYWNTENSLEISAETDRELQLNDLKLFFVREGNALSAVIQNQAGVSKVPIEGDTILPLSTDSFAVALYEIKSIVQTVYECKPGDILKIGRSDADIILDNKSVSRHHATVLVYDGYVSVRDQHSVNGTYRNGEKITAKITTQKCTYEDVVDISGFSLTFAPGKIIVSEIPPVRQETRTIADDIRKFVSDKKVDKRGFVPEKKDDKRGLVSEKKDVIQKIEEPAKNVVKRSPRLKREIPTDNIRIPDPPSMISKPEINWLATFLPAFITVALAVVMTVVMSNPMMMIYSLPMTVGGLVVSLANYFRQKKQYKTKTASREEKYNALIEEMDATIKSKYDLQLSSMVLDYPRSEDCLNIAKTKAVQLWQRRPSDPDFAKVRIGTGEVDLSVKLEYSDNGLSLEEDPLKEKGKELYDKYHKVGDAPIICDLSENVRCGVVGPGHAAVSFFTNLFIQLCTHYCYSELKIVCVCDRIFSREMSWIRKLPHFMDDSREAVFVADNMGDADQLLQYFSDVLKQRKVAGASSGSRRETTAFLPHFVFVIQDQTLLDKTSNICAYLLRENNISTSVIFAANDLSELPKECHEIVEFRGSEGEIYSTSDINEKTHFVSEALNQWDLAPFADAMKDYICEDENVRNTIPSSYTFFEMYGIKSPEDVDLSKWWAASNVLKSLSTPIGIGENGKPITLDLHERGHGPHGLVAGTTGSGKSEFLQSYIISAALHFHPYEIGFLLIDFKGGGMANQFEKLPHLLGTITNISKEEINRSLSSIRAELLRRQKLFAESRVNSIEAYIEQYKSGRVSIPIPHLVIIVDEFAELKADQPEFMKELISTARIGRSLGVHLILATQKPAGSVSDEIWSNSKFQVCLKVATLQDSTEVIRSPLAANIKEPGRAYIRVGNNEIFELFQSGYSGVKIGGKTQLQLMIDLIEDYCEKNHIARLEPICLPPLPESISYTPAAREKGLTIGMFDDPENLVQGEYELDFRGRNTLIVGAAQAGKTNLLQCVIRRFAEQYTSKEINIYIMDFASMVLKNFEGLNHVGGVVTSLEDEKFENLIKLINTEIELRRRAFMKIGVSSFASYCESGKTDIPQIILLIDNLTAVHELYCQDDDVLLPILQNGPSYGISIIAGCYQTTGIGYKYLSSFANHIAFFCHDSGEYNSLFGYSPMNLPEISGRCIVEREKKLFFCQTYLAFEGEKEVDRAGSIKAFVERMNLVNPLKAPRIPVIPDEFPHETAMKACESCLRAPGDVILGLDYSDVSPFVLNLRKELLVGICGDSYDGSAELISHIVKSCMEQYPDGAEFFIVDDINRVLRDLSALPVVREYSFLTEKAGEYIKTVATILAERYAKLAEGDSSVLDNSKIEVVILNGNEVFRALERDTMASSALTSILDRFKNLNVCIILGNLENALINYNSPEILKKLKENPRIIFMGDLDDAKVVDVPFSIVRQYRKSVDPGAGYYIAGSDCVKLRLAGRYQ